MKATHWLALSIYVVSSASFVLQFWPLAAVGVIALTFVGGGLLSLPLALLLDLAYGEPTGYAAYLFFPYTVAALAIVTIRHTAGRYFLRRASRDTL